MVLRKVTGQAAMDMESLLRQALNRHDSPDTETRLRIYKVARNALSKTISRNGDFSPDILNAQGQMLEKAIRKIERELASDSKPDRIPEIAQNRNAAWSPEGEAPFSRVSIPKSFDPAFAQWERQGVPVNNESRLQPEPKLSQQHSGEVKTDHVRPRRKPAKYVIWILMTLMIAIVSRIAYNISSEIMNPRQSGDSRGEISQNKRQGAESGFFVILDPGQPGSLVTAENGVAEILDKTSRPAIRIMSVRQAGNRHSQARPILLQLPPGILKDIAGKRATVEILAKSGEEEAVTFAVSCDFGELGECGRKRFRIGKQPETVVFSIQIPEDYKEGQRAYLALNTDVTHEASLSGKGSRIDVFHARIYVNHEP